MSGRLEDAAAGWRRLLPQYRQADLDTPEHLPWLIGRLLEEGDSNDLRWLVDHCGEEEIVAWVRQRGNRQLSARSRAFWALVLDLETATFEENPLWPI